MLRIENEKIRKDFWGGIKIPELKSCFDFFLLGRVCPPKKRNNEEDINYL